MKPPQSYSFRSIRWAIPISVTFHGAIANELALAQKIVELKNKIDYEKAQFKRNMAKLSVADVQSFKQTLHELKEQFHQKLQEVMSNTQPSSCRRCWASKCRGL